MIPFTFFCGKIIITIIITINAYEKYLNMSSCVSGWAEQQFVLTSAFLVELWTQPWATQDHQWTQMPPCHPALWQHLCVAQRNLREFMKVTSACNQAPISSNGLYIKLPHTAS